MPSLKQEYVNWLPQNQVTNDIVHVYIDLNGMRWDSGNYYLL